MNPLKKSLSLIITITFIVSFSHLNAQDENFNYAYISVSGKIFSKKLKVVVDFGDTPEQIKAGEEYSEILTNKRSYAAVLNYMVEQDFELVDSMDFNFSYQGTGGTEGIVFIMRKTITGSE
ncbi:MAG: hypothetical protein R3345_12675 [Fulvivirga sp.]|nr:hypothetical protein [Fulvivirga sp.]